MSNTPEGKRTSARAKMVEGVTFHCYWVGISNYRWVSEDGRAMCARRYSGVTYYARVDGETAGRLFLSLESAIRAAVKHMRKLDRHHDAEYAKRNVL